MIFFSFRDKTGKNALINPPITQNPKQEISESELPLDLEHRLKFILSFNDSPVKENFLYRLKMWFEEVVNTYKVPLDFMDIYFFDVNEYPDKKMMVLLFKFMKVPSIRHWIVIPDEFYPVSKGHFKFLFSLPVNYEDPIKFYSSQIFFFIKSSPFINIQTLLPKKEYLVVDDTPKRVYVIKNIFELTRLFILNYPDYIVHWLKKAMFYKNLLPKTLKEENKEISLFILNHLHPYLLFNLFVNYVKEESSRKGFKFLIPFYMKKEIINLIVDKNTTHFKFFLSYDGENTLFHAYYGEHLSKTLNEYNNEINDNSESMSRETNA